jgi:hypothetical protein
VAESIYTPDPREPASYGVLPGGDLGGGPSELQVFENLAPAAPPNPAIAAVSFELNGGPEQQWSVALQAWV